VIYFDTAYLARLYLEDAGWEQVRALAQTDRVACCLHGRAETIAAFHRKHREGRFDPIGLRGLIEQFNVDCVGGGYQWLPLSELVIVRLTKAYALLPKTIPLRSADAIHLACAAENGCKDIFSNDPRVLDGASHFGLKGVNVI
jgi:predicted nucleic acid-binding protein